MRIRLVALLWILFINSSIAQETWPQFRGPQGDGHADSSRLPLNWTDSSNVVWKTAIHDRGWSSPVIWENQVWLTTATRDGKTLFALCIDRNGGKVIFDLEVFKVESPQSITTDNTYASPTPVVDANSVYFHFGTYGTACFDRRTGKRIWERRDLKCDHEKGAGPASSPMLHQGRLLVNVDGRDVQYVIALDKATGKTIWKTNRSVDYRKVPVHQRKAYSTPIIAPRGDRHQLISVGGRGLFAYDPHNGDELWRVRHRGWSQAPRPVFGDGIVYSTIDRDDPELWAIRADGAGDVTESHILWKEGKAMPRRCSPLLIEGNLYLMSRTGVVTCLAAKTGKLIWRDRLPGAYSASPIYDGNRIYFFNEEATTYVIEPGNRFKVLAKNPLPKEKLLASPAVALDSLFIRTESHLYRIAIPEE